METNTSTGAVRAVIPWVPPSLNRALRTHWSGRHRTSKVAAGYLLAGLGKRHGAPPGRVRVTIQMYRKRPMDRDGATGSCKPIFDALVRFGWALDDSEKWMDQVVLPVVVENKPPKTEIEILEISSGILTP
jgi:hypothetical protein